MNVRKKQRNSQLNQIIRKISNILRDSLEPLSKSQIEEHLKSSITQDILEAIIHTQQQKIIFDEKTEKFSYKKCYQVQDFDSLKMLISDTPDGIVEDSDLSECYKSITQDLNKLRKERLVRVIKNLETKKNVYYPIKVSDPIEQTYTSIKQQDLLKDLWNGIQNLNQNERIKRMEDQGQQVSKQFLIPQKRANDKQKIKDKAKKKRKIKKLVNTHLEEDFNLDEGIM